VKICIRTPSDFRFRSAVCSHGFFALAPNRWHPPTRTLHTVVGLDASAAVGVAIREGPGRVIVIESGDELPAPRRAAVGRAVRRILRVDEDLSAFHRRCRASPGHARAASIGFGRLLRSASLFEDIVKVICTCNTTWRQTTAMVRGLVAWGTPAEQSGGNQDGPARAFPTPQQLAGVRETALKKRARVGYRSAFIRRLARDVADGRLDLGELESFDGPSDELYQRLKHIRGIGDYGAANLCMLLGRYDRLAVDSEMLRLFRQRHPERAWTPADLRAYYECWRPFQFLAYWFDLWQDYVERHGQADQWWPNTTGQAITNPRPAAGAARIRQGP
jgi:3-methyladenine DNA glycosylase/8-oxoguanine DNA glycosylase